MLQMKMILTFLFQSLTSDEIIIDGDFNLVLDVEKDKKGGIPRSHKKSLEAIQKYSENR